MLLMTLEDLGFCKKGEAGPFVEGGRLRIDGDLPTNTDGGGLERVPPRPAWPVPPRRGRTRQLRGDCGSRQVPDAELACVSGTGGWFCSSGTMILGRG